MRTTRLAATLMRPSSFGASFTFTAFTKGKIKADGTNYQSEYANDHYCLKEDHKHFSWLEPWSVHIWRTRSTIIPTVSSAAQNTTAAIIPGVRYCSPACKKNSKVTKTRTRRATFRMNSASISEIAFRAPATGSPFASKELPPKVSSIVERRMFLSSSFVPF